MKGKHTNHSNIILVHPTNKQLDEEINKHRLFITRCSLSKTNKQTKTNCALIFLLVSLDFS